ncbi:hypothetical protein OF83DRAFT_202873, partial [Amylostereum chailletii]
MANAQPSRGQAAAPCTQHDDPQIVQTQTPIAVRMPTEVLLEIFSHSIENDQHDAENSATTAFTISHVCRRWRDVAIDYALMWAKLSFKSEAMFTTMLERARQTPLSVCVDLTPRIIIRRPTTGGYRFQTACVALREISRVKEISIRSVSCLPLRNVVSLLRPTASRLERLELRASEISRNMTDVFKVEKSFWSQAAMPLQKLVLEAVQFDNPSLNLVPRHCQALTHLELGRMGSMRMVDIMAMIAVAAHTLETLILDHLTFRNLQPTTITPVTLPRLTYLQISSVHSTWEPNTPVSILQHIKYPDTASLILQFTLKSRLTPNTVLPAILAHLRTRSPTYQSILLQTDNMHRRPGLRLSAWTRRGAPNLFNLDEYPGPALALHILRDEDVDEVCLLDALGDIAVAAKFESVREATVAPVKPELPWARFFRHIPLLRELSVYGPAALHEFCSVYAFSTFGAWPHVVSETAELFSHLTTLSITGVSFREGYLKEPTLELEALKAGLERFEQVRGAKLEEVVVCYCDTITRDMEEIAKSVKRRNVVWDGSERGTSSVPMSMVVESPPAPETMWPQDQHGAMIGLGPPDMDEEVFAEGGPLAVPG